MSNFGEITERTELDKRNEEIDKDELERAMGGHILATGQLMGTYKLMASQTAG
jgi:phosphatidylethanolamine-binding protein (PEBP) family uncharacterized protein